LCADTAGAGRRRGGLGQEIVVRSIATRPMTLTLRPDKMFFPPPGLNNGQVGVTGKVFINGQQITRFPPIQFNPGDVLRLQMPGGAGFGAVSERPPEMIRRDLELGYVSAEAAERVYGLSVDA